MTTTDELKDKVVKLRGAELALEDQLAAAKTDLVTAREREADAALAGAMGGGGRKSGESAAAVGERIVGLIAAIDAARSRRVEAIRAIWAAEAENVRAQAAKTAAQAEQHTAKTAELLKALEAHENAAYVPESRIADELVGAGLGFSRSFTVPRSEAMDREIEGLEFQAKKIESKQVTMGGSLAAANPDGLVTAVRDVDPMTIGPTLHSVRDWLGEQEPAITAKLSQLRSGTGDQPHLRPTYSVEYRVSWCDGELDSERSDFTIQLHQPRPGGELGPREYVSAVA